MPATPETLNVVSIRIVNFSKTIFKYFSTFFNDHTDEFLSLQLDNGWVEPFKRSCEPLRTYSTCAWEQDIGVYRVYCPWRSVSIITLQYRALRYIRERKLIHSIRYTGWP